MRRPRAVSQTIADARYVGWGVHRIGDELSVGGGTVQRELEGTGLNRLPRVARRPVQHYEKRRPSKLLHLDLKYLPALDNWPKCEYAAIDDFSGEGCAH
jgi:hypothetical protein